MSLKTVKYGARAERKNYTKVSSSFPMPDLLEVQKNSYKRFLDEGIKNVLEEISPVENFTGTLSLEFAGYRFDDLNYSIQECKDRELTYSRPMKVDVRLFNNETGEVKEQEIFLGDLPMMTESGTFVINGAERVVVSQLVRSPSAYYAVSVDKKTGAKSFTSQVIPNRGTWLEYEMDAKGILYVRIDRTRKIPVTVFLRALGLSSDQDIIDMFGDSEVMQLTIAKDITKNSEEALVELYEKLRPGEPATVESSKSLLVARFFDPFRYDLSEVGRYKFNKKLGIIDRIFGMTLAEDIKIKTKVIAKKGDVVDKKVVEALKPHLATNFSVESKINEDLDEFGKVQIVHVYSPNDNKKVIKVIGNDQSLDAKRISISDIYASVSYYLNLLDGVGKTDVIDHLGNRRVRQVGELLKNQFRIGFSRTERVIKEKMTTLEIEKITPKSLINIRPITASFKEFFGSSQLSQFLDQTNPLAEITHKRRLSALGPGGLSRDRAGFEVRDVHYSHYGRICPIETPEGPNIGLINTLATYGKINHFGFIMTPYRKVVKSIVTDEVEYLTADAEVDYVIAQANINLNEEGKIKDKKVASRYRGENIMMEPKNIDYCDVSPKQIVSVASSCIPFLEHDDANRTLMGANMQRQGLPLLKTDSPIVGTGIEYIAAHDSGQSVVSKNAGVVDYVDAKKIIIKTKKGKDTYDLITYERSNNGTCFTQKPIVSVGEKIKKDIVIADGPSTQNGELALGKNMTVAFMTWDGYNYEDAIIINERLVKDDVYTSIHIKNYELESRDTKLGPEIVTRDIPNVSEDARKNLDSTGIIRIGAEVKEGDILVGKVTPKGVKEMSSEEKLLHAIFGEKSREVRDTSLRVPHGGNGIIHDVKVFNRENKDELPAGVNMVVRVYITQKRKIGVGDKMAGRHGNKGVISIVLPQEDMPYLEDGTPVDIMLNPLGVPSRMNIGQILEIHLGMAAKKLNIKVATPVFEGANNDEISDLMKKADMDEDGKTYLHDGRTGKKFDKKVSVGVMYMLKLEHMVDDKLHARAIGPYSLVTQQPLGGKAQMGGQRFGEMEVWALEAYGASHILQEILTVKSDDVEGRVKAYEALVKGRKIEQAGVPESFRVLVKELQALGLDLNIFDKEKNIIEMKQIQKKTVKEDIALEEIIKDETKTVGME